jgi:hypothetical protein
VESVNGHIDIACDQAIFKRVLPYQKENEKVRPFLGQWHTNKDMMSALIAIFSGYGLFGIAASLGVRYLDKLEKVVDYRSTCRVLDLIWASVGIAIVMHTQETNRHYHG